MVLHVSRWVRLRLTHEKPSSFPSGATTVLGLGPGSLRQLPTDGGLLWAPDQQELILSTLKLETVLPVFIETAIGPMLVGIPAHSWDEDSNGGWSTYRLRLQPDRLVGRILDRTGNPQAFASFKIRYEGEE